MANAALQFISASAKQRHANVTMFGLPSQHARYDLEASSTLAHHFTSQAQDGLWLHTSYQLMNVAPRMRPTPGVQKRQQHHNPKSITATAATPNYQSPLW